MNIGVIILNTNKAELDEAIIGLLTQAGQPLCVSTISFLLGRPGRDICMVLNKLRKYREVKKVTSRPVQFWSVAGR